jgi:urease accessory protein
MRSSRGGYGPFAAPTTLSPSQSRHPARPLTRGEWRSAAEMCAHHLRRFAQGLPTSLETPPHPRAGGELYQFGAAALLLLPAVAYAHHPMGGTVPSTVVEGLLSGLGHPLIGIDHFLFIAGAGVLAARFERGYILPLVFVFASIFTTLVRYLGADAGLGELPVAASLVVLGAMMLGSSSATPREGVIALFFLLAGTLHGHALGEAIVGAEQTPLVAYLAGLAIIQSATGLAAWRATTWLVARRPQLPLQKIAGSVVSVAGLVFGAMAAF